MKKVLLTLFLLANFLFAFSQEMMYEVRPTHDRSVKREALNHAQNLRDFIPGYPVNWVTSYISVEMLGVINGKVRTAMSMNDHLTTEQKYILQNADLSSDIVVNVQHRYRNPVTDSVKVMDVHVTMTVVPEVEAEFIGGYSRMSKYLYDHAIEKIAESCSKKIQPGKVSFTVNEEGKVINAKLKSSTGDAKADKMLLNAIIQMPLWKPAMNENGKRVKQDFVFNVGNNGC